MSLPEGHSSQLLIAAGSGKKIAEMAWTQQVARIAGNDVDVSVLHGLAGRYAVVHGEIKAGGLVALFEQTPQAFHQSEALRIFVVAQGKETRDVAPGNDQSMSK